MSGAAEKSAGRKPRVVSAARLNSLAQKYHAAAVLIESANDSLQEAFGTSQPQDPNLKGALNALEGATLRAMQLSGREPVLDADKKRDNVSHDTEFHGHPELAQMLEELILRLSTFEAEEDGKPTTGEPSSGLTKRVPSVLLPRAAAAKPSKESALSTVRSALRSGATALLSRAKTIGSDPSSDEADMGGEAANRPSAFSTPEVTLTSNDDEMLKQPVRLKLESNSNEDIQGDDCDLRTRAPLVDWLLRDLQPLAKEKMQIEYHPLQIREILLKCVIAMEHPWSDVELEPLGKLAQDLPEYLDQNEKEKCIWDAYFTIFLYTVDCMGYHNLPVNECLEALKLRWNQCQLDGKKLEKLSSYRVMPGSFRPQNAAGHGFNATHWALMNWCLRVANDECQDDDVRKSAEIGTGIFRPFSQRLQWVLQHLPTHHGTVFRGIKGTTTRRYRMNDSVIWHAFSSTSTADREALNFMGKGRGVFFTIHTHTACNVRFASWFPRQQEALIPRGARFSVQTRASDTVLAMLESKTELITMYEAGMSSALSPYEAAMVTVRAASRTTFVFGNFLEKYVIGTVGPVPNSRKGAMSIDTLIKDILTVPTSMTDSSENKEDETRTRQHRMILVGGGGTGKTSAMLYLFSTLMHHTAKAGEDSDEKAPFPVFIPLPSIPQLTSEFAMDKHLLQMLGLRTDDLKALCERRRLVLLLDSLDEVEGVLHKTIFMSKLLEQNPLILHHSSWIVLSTREETATVATIAIPDSEVLYCQPFNEEDKLAYLRKVETEGIEAKLKSLSMWELVDTPFLLYLASKSLSFDSGLFEKIRALLTGPNSYHPYGLYELYEAYFHAWTSSFEQTDNNVMDYLKIVSDAASTITRDGSWKAPVGDVGRLHIKHVTNILRLENLDDYDSGVSFRHKSLQDFLVARQLYEELASGSDAVLKVHSDLNTVGYISRSFPAVLRLVRDRLVRDEPNFHSICTILAKCCTRSANPRFSCSASNAISIMCSLRIPIREYVGTEGLCRGKFVNANLDYGNFHGMNLQGTQLVNCSIQHADLSHTNMTDVDAPGTTTGTSTSVEAHSSFVTSVSCSPDGRYLLTTSADRTCRAYELPPSFCNITSTELDVHAVKSFATLELQSYVSGGCFYPDGKSFFVSTLNGKMKKFSATSNPQQEGEDIVKSVSSILSMKFSSSGTILAMLTAAGVVKLFDASQSYSDLKNPKEKDASCMCFSFDEQSFAVGGDKGAITLYNLTMQKRKATSNDDGDAAPESAPSLEEPGASPSLITLSDSHTLSVLCMCYSPCGRYLTSGSEDKNLMVFDTRTGELCATLSQNSSHVMSVCYTKNGKLLMYTSADIVTIVSTDTFRVQRTIATSSSVYCMSLAAEDRLILTGCEDGSVKFFSTIESSSDAQYAGPTDVVTSCCYSQNGTILAVGCVDGKVSLFSSQTGGFLRTLCLEEIPVTSMFFLPNDEFLVIAAGSQIRLYEPLKSSSALLQSSTATVLLSGESPSESPITSMDLSPPVPTSSNQCLAVGRLNGELTIVDIGKRCVVQTLQEKDLQPLKWVSFSHDNKWLLSGSVNGGVSIREYSTNTSTSASCTFPGPVHCVAVSPCKSTIAISYGEATEVRLLDLSPPFTQGNIQQVISMGETPPTTVAFSPNGDLIAVGHHNETVTLFTVAGTASSSVFSLTLEGCVHTLRFSPDSRMIAAGCVSRALSIISVNKQNNNEDRSELPTRYLLDSYPLLSAAQITGTETIQSNPSLQHLLLARKETTRRAVARDLLRRAVSEGLHSIVEWITTLEHCPDLLLDPKGNTALSIASGRGHEAVVKVLISNGANVCHSNFLGSSPCHLAALRGRSSVIQSLQSHGVEIEAQDLDHSTPLFFAALGGHLETIRLLHSIGAQVNTQTLDKNTPMHAAARNGHTKVIDLLHSLGGKLDATDKSGFSPIAVASQEGHLETVKKLHSLGAKLDYKPLYYASFNGHTVVVEALHSLGARIDAASDGGLTPMYAAAQKGHLETVKKLHSLGAKVDAATQGGYTPLMTAAQGGHIETLKFLSGSGADVNAKAKGGFTSVYLAATNGHPDAVETLHSLGADVNAVSDGGFSPVYSAAQKGHLEVVKKLYGLGAKIDVAVKDGYTPLMTAAQGGHIETLKFLCRNGADVNATATGGFRPIYHASMNGNPAIVDVLHSFGAHVDVLTDSEFTPMYSAAQKGHLEVVKKLYGLGAKIDVAVKDGYTPLMTAAQGGHIETLKFLCHNGADVNAKAKGGFTSVYLAATNGHPDAVETLHSLGADVNVFSDGGFSPVYSAAQKGHLEVVKKLHSLGANIDIPCSGYTPLMTAAQGGHIETLKFLSGNGADVNAKAKGGFTSLYLAATNGHPDVVETLHSLGAEVNVVSDGGFTPVYSAAQKGHLEVVKKLHSLGANIDIPCSGYTPLQAAAQHSEVVKFLKSVSQN